MFNRPRYKLPIPLALLKQIQFRNQLRKQNLHDTFQLPDHGKLHKPISDGDQTYLTKRTINGSYNDFEHPEMRMANTRFGHNVSLSDTAVDIPNIHNPSRRIVSEVFENKLDESKQYR